MCLYCIRLAFFPDTPIAECHFCFRLPLHSFWALSYLNFTSVFCWASSGAESHLHWHIFLHFILILRDSQGRNIGVVTFPPHNWTIFSELSHPWPGDSAHHNHQTSLWIFLSTTPYWQAVLYKGGCRVCLVISGMD